MRQCGIIIYSHVLVKAEENIKVLLVATDIRFTWEYIPEMCCIKTECYCLLLRKKTCHRR